MVRLGAVTCLPGRAALYLVLTSDTVLTKHILEWSSLAEKTGVVFQNFGQNVSDHESVKPLVTWPVCDLGFWLMK